MLILGIETSCDETAASVIKGHPAHKTSDGKTQKITVLSNIVSSQIEIHKKYGGVVPEVAAREHVLNILPVINEALEKSGITKNISPLTKGRCPQGRGVDAIAVTAGPGLITSLIAGVETAKTLSYAWKIPTVSVNHIEGHVYANFITNQKINFPALILTVSGGHTILALMKDHGKIKTIGETRDDAAGEAFDKAAKLMNLDYPGGPAISQEAKKFSNSKSEIKLPRPMINSNNFDFSFSGLKTAIRYALENDNNWQKKIPEYCFEFQQAVIDVLIHKTLKASLKYNIKTIMLSGGVSANRELRKQFKKAIKKTGLDFHMPELSYTTDNATMIASAGYFKALRKKFTPWQDLKADCNLEL